MTALDPDRLGRARFVGGPVRNALMGLPVDDIDIATTLKPDETIAVAEGAGLRAVPTGLDHGTVTVVADHHPYEVTTLRVDLHTDGRHAIVGFTEDWREDAKRRDFTMNALYCDQDGTVHDPMGGYADLIARRVRFVGDPATRIREDVLRILRFYRFFATYGADVPDFEAIAACRAHVDLLPLLSGERVRMELLKLLRASSAVRAVRQMEVDGVLAKLLPKGFETDRLDHLVTHLPEADAVQRLGALARPPADDLAKRLRLSNAERDRLHAAWSDRFAGPFDEGTIARHFYRHGPQVVLDRIAEAVARGQATAEDYRRAASQAAHWIRPTLPINGSDAKSAGVVPGPQMGAVLRAVEDWWVEHDFAPDRDACLAKLRALV